MNLERYLVRDVPPRVNYVPNFITAEEEFNIINRVNNAPKPKWTQLLNRRLQNWGGIPHPKGMISESIPEVLWLEEYIGKVKALGVFSESNQPNHVLVNEYKAGQGIMPHTDGPLFHPIVTTITCGSHTVLEFYKRQNHEAYLDRDDVNVSNLEPANMCSSLVLERRSLLILQEDMYHNFLHGISERTQDTIDNKIKNLSFCQVQEGDLLNRSTRISLTIRNVPKSTKLKLFS